jgi:hypothetical protein
MEKVITISGNYSGKSFRRETAQFEQTSKEDVKP